MSVYTFDFAEPQWVNYFAFTTNTVSFTWELWGVVKSGELVALKTEQGRDAEGRVIGSITNDRVMSTRTEVDFVTTQLISIQLIVVQSDTEINTGLYTLSTTTNVNLSDVVIALRTSQESVPQDLGRDNSQDVITQSDLGYVETAFVERLFAGSVLNSENTQLWMSSPQPVASAIVPLYLDLRDEDGAAMVFDSIIMNPVESGAQVSVYTSNDESVLGYRLGYNYVNGSSGSVELAQQTYVDYQNTDLTYGKVLPQKRGRIFTNPTDVVSFDEINKYSGLVEGLADWSIGFTVQPLYDYLLENETYNFISLSSASVSLDIYYDGNTDSLVVDYQDNTASVNSVINSYPIVLSELKWYAIVVSNSSGNLPTMNIHVLEVGTQTNSTIEEHFGGVGISGAQVFTDLKIGNNSTSTAVARGALSCVWIRRETFVEDDDPVLVQYARDPEQFCRGLKDYDRSRVDYNAVFLARLFETLEARIGCDSLYFEGKLWTPLINFTLKSRNFRIPTISAKFLKFEFTNLNPRPYRQDVLVTSPYKREILTYPSWVHEWYSQQQTSTDLNNNDVVLYDPYDDLQSYRAYTSSLDPVLPQNVHKSFFRECIHTYTREYVEVDNDYQYFVGLNSLQITRQTSGSVALDVREFTDSFLDTELIEETELNVYAGYLQSSGRQAVVTKLFTTVSDMIGMQVALSSSDWIDLLGEDKTILLDYDHIETVDGGFIVTTTSRPDVIEGNRLQVFPNRANPYDDSSDIFDNVTDTYDDYELSGVVPGEYGISASVQCNIAPYASNAARYDEEVDIAPFNTLSALYDDSTDTYDSEAISDFGDLEQVLLRISAGVRLYLPDSNNGTYELRIYKDDVLKHREVLKRVPLQKWSIYSTSTNLETPGEYKAEIVQTDSQVSEVFVVSYLGVFLSPFSVSYAADGLNWTQEKTIGSGVNNSDHIIAFSDNTTTMALKIVSAVEGATLTGYTVIPIYRVALPLSRSDIISAESNLYSDSSYYRPAERKDRFFIQPLDIPAKYLV